MKFYCMSCGKERVMPVGRYDLAPCSCGSQVWQTNQPPTLASAKPVGAFSFGGIVEGNGFNPIIHGQGCVIPGQFARPRLRVLEGGKDADDGPAGD